MRCFKPLVDPSSLTGGVAGTSWALHSTRRRRVPPGAAQMNCLGLFALRARSLVEHAAWASCRRATSDLKHLAGTCSWLGKAIVSHRGDGAAWPRGPQIDWHRTGMRAATVLIVAARRAAAGMHARRHQRGQERRWARDTSCSPRPRGGGARRAWLRLRPPQRPQARCYRGSPMAPATGRIAWADGWSRCARGEAAVSATEPRYV